MRNWFDLDPATIATIAGMASVSYLCRAGGYWLFGQIRPTPVVQSMLRTLPGALFVSYVAPALVAGQLQDWIGSAATLAAMITTRNLGVAIGVGLAAAWAVHASL